MGILNRAFSPRNSVKEKNTICILWSSVQPFTDIDTWVPNHFVLIKPNSTRKHFIFLILWNFHHFPQTAELTYERPTDNDTSETVEPTDERSTNNGTSEIAELSHEQPTD